MKNFEEVIYQGAVFKNYKELCEALGEKVTTGEHKRIQLESWTDLFEWENEGHKFVITDVKDNIHTALKQIESTRSNLLTYTQLAICTLVMNKMKTNKEEHNNVDFVELSLSEIAQAIGYINQVYSQHVFADKIYLSETVKSAYPRTKGIKGSDVEEIASVISKACTKISQSYSRRVKQALERLRSKKIIYYTPVMYIETATPIRDVSDIKYNVKKSKYNKTRGVIIENDIVLNKKRVATDDEIKFITNTEKQVLNEMGADDIQQIIKGGKFQEYKERVSNSLANSELHIWKYYEVYKIIPADKYLEDETNELYKTAQSITKEFRETLGVNEERRMKRVIYKPSRDEYDNIDSVKLSEEEELELVMYKHILNVLIDKAVEKRIIDN